jgi:hypothetical protein
VQRRDHLRPALEVLEDRTLLSVYTVDRLTDTGAGSGFTGDLRYCITQATTDGDTITFAVAGTIYLTAALPDLKTQLTIQGPGAGLLTVDGQYKARVFWVRAGASVEISGLTLTHGAGEVSGGAIENEGTLTLNLCTVSENFAYGFDTLAIGGGIDNYRGSLLVNASTISNNSATSLDIYTGSYGGGLDNDQGTAVITNSTISGNTVSACCYALGGGLFNDATMTVSNSTIFGNTVGGGLWNAGTLTVANSTIASNTGGGLNNYTPSSMRNTIVAYNSDGDVAGHLASSGYNLISNSSGGSGYDATDLLDVDPMLGPLADNGGPTQTMALLPGSPAIDAGDNTGAPRWDQRGRGYDRIVNGQIDIGAFEVQPGDAPVPVFSLLTDSFFTQTLAPLNPSSGNRADSFASTSEPINPLPPVTGETEAGQVSRAVPGSQNSGPGVEYMGSWNANGLDPLSIDPWNGPKPEVA